MNDLGFFFICLVIFIVIFLLCRELVCWYWKINSRITTMEQMVKNQEVIISLLKKQIPEEKQPTTEVLTTGANA